MTCRRYPQFFWVCQNGVEKMNWVTLAGVVLGIIPVAKMIIVTGKMIVDIVLSAIISGIIEIPFRVVGLIISTIFAIKILIITWGLSWVAWTYTPEFWGSVRGSIVSFSWAVCIPSILFFVWCIPLFKSDEQN